MPIHLKCAWCGILIGIKEGEIEDLSLSISHTICPACSAKLNGMITSWDGVERRLSEDRRKGERRTTMRTSVCTLIVIDGITWIDNEGTDRRRNLRRRSDREWLASKIIDGID